MKKISLLILLLISNLSIISCTKQSIADAVDTPNEIYSTAGETDPNDSSEEPPSDGN